MLQEVCSHFNKKMYRHGPDVSIGFCGLHCVRAQMTTPTFTGPSGLAEFSETCATELFKAVQYQFTFPVSCTLQNWPIEDIKRANKELLKTLRHSGNVYVLFVRAPTEGANWVPVYVGERKSVGLRERITQHLIDKDERTGSMLEAVKTAVTSGSTIGLSFIKVLPESLRLYVEETIISKHKSFLPWNTHS